MAITQEQYDKFSVGDTITVVESHGSNHKLHVDVVITGGRPQWENPDNSDVYAITGSSGYNIIPGRGGIHFTLIEHKPKPKPAWVENDVIVVNGEYYLANGQGFTNANGTKFSIEEITDFGTVEVVA